MSVFFICLFSLCLHIFHSASKTQPVHQVRSIASLLFVTAWSNSAEVYLQTAKSLQIGSLGGENVKGCDLCSNCKGLGKFTLWSNASSLMETVCIGLLTLKSFRHWRGRKSYLITFQQEAYRRDTLVLICLWREGWTYLLFSSFLVPAFHVQKSCLSPAADRLNINWGFIILSCRVLLYRKQLYDQARKP